MKPIVRPVQLGGVLALLISLPLASAAQAAAPLPPILVQAEQAVKAAHSYLMTETTVSTDTLGTTTISSATTIVRPGNTLEMYVLTHDTEEDGKKSTTDMVVGAKHTCIRLTGEGAWNCTMLGNMSSLINTTTSFTQAGSKSTWSPAGTRVVHGQTCAGFNLTTTTSTLKSHGTMWLSLAAKVPVQLTLYGTYFNKANPSKDVTTIIWSNWNDPKLSIPNVGA